MPIVYPHLAHVEFATWSDTQVIAELRQLITQREALRGPDADGDEIARLTVERITPLEMELVARQIPATIINPLTTPRQ